MKAVSLLGLVALMLAAPARAEAPAETRPDWRPVSLLYEVHAGGLHVFTINLEAALGTRDYDLSLSARTDGTLAWLLDWSLMSAVNGRPAEAGPAPDWFRSESAWRGKERWVELRYGAGEGAAPGVESVPPPEEDDRPRVPDALRVGTVDPLSAGIGLIYALADQAHCDTALPVFDGRRRFEAKSRDLGMTEIAVSDLAPYGGEARACAVTVEPVTGFWRDSKYKPEPQDFTVFLRTLSTGEPALPVRIEADTRFGAVRVHLVDYAPRSPGAPDGDGS